MDRYSAIRETALSLHTDHLNTPRLIADANQTTVWKWEQAEPFGNTVPNEDPDADTVAFEFPLRSPGQYADKETNLHYNYFRDYDSAIRQYAQSDPIGLSAGLNTYLFVNATPLLLADSDGLLGKSPGGMANKAAGWYGNWCGPGGKGSPMDCVDNACKRHDQCYDACGVRAGTRWFPPALWQKCAASCDDEFANDLRNCSDKSCKP